MEHNENEQIETGTSRKRHKLAGLILAVITLCAVIFTVAVYANEEKPIPAEQHTKIVEQGEGYTFVEFNEASTNLGCDLIQIKGKTIQLPCSSEDLLNISDDLRIEYDTVTFKDDVGILYQNEDYICHLTKDNPNRINCIMFNPNEYITLCDEYFSDAYNAEQALDKLNVFEKNIYETKNGYIYRYTYTCDLYMCYINIICNKELEISTIALLVEMEK